MGLPSAHSAPHRRPRVSDHDMQKCYLDRGQAHSPTKFSPQSPSITRNSQRQQPGKTLPVFNVKTSMTFGKFQVFDFKASKYHMLKSPMNQSLVKMPSPMKHLFCENCSIYYRDMLLLLLNNSKSKSNLTLEGTVLLFSRDDILASTLSV